MNKARMEALSDGIFAIALTILVLDIKIPHVDSGKLMGAFIIQLPSIFAFLLSFIIIGMYWVAHHSLTNYITQVNRSSLWLNLLNLLTICFLPFPTGILGEYLFNQFSVIFYALSLSMVNITGTLFWLHSTALKENKTALTDSTRKRIAIIYFSPVIFYLFAIGFSFVQIYMAYAVFIFVPLFYILPNKFRDDFIGGAKSD